MKTCFVVHDSAVALALRSHIGPDARVLSPGDSAPGLRFERLIMVDEPSGAGLSARPAYEAWFRDLATVRTTPDAKLVNVPARFRPSEWLL